MLMFLVGILFFNFFPSNFTRDTDKCEVFIGKCHMEATCNNTHGSYVCICKSGFIGDRHIVQATVNSLNCLLMFILVTWQAMF